MEQRSWQLVMGVEDNKVHFQVVSLDGKTIHYNYQGTIQSKEYTQVKKVLNTLAPKKRDMKDQGFIIDAREIFLYVRDGARAVEGAKMENCNRVGAINSKLPLLILSFFQIDKISKK